MCRTGCRDSSKLKWHLYLLVFTQTSCVLWRSLHIRKCWWFPSNQQVKPGSVWSLFISTGYSYILPKNHKQHFTFFDILLINCNVPLCFVWQRTRGWFHRAGALSSPTTICWHLLITTLGKTGNVIMHSCIVHFWDFISWRISVMGPVCWVFEKDFGPLQWRKETSMNGAAGVTSIILISLFCLVCCGYWYVFTFCSTLFVLCYC